jgi:hypothetical protein
LEPFNAHPLDNTETTLGTFDGACDLIETMPRLGTDGLLFGGSPPGIRPSDNDVKGHLLTVAKCTPPKLPGSVAHGSFADAGYTAEIHRKLSAELHVSVNFNTCCGSNHIVVVMKKSDEAC